MKKLFVLLALAACQVQAGEPRFNALDPTDPLYAEYQRNLCSGSYEDYQRFYSARYWMDQQDPKLAKRTEDQRQDWVVDYVVTTELRDKSLLAFESNCR